MVGVRDDVYSSVLFKPRSGWVFLAVFLHKALQSQTVKDRHRPPNTDAC